MGPSRLEPRPGLPSARGACPSGRQRGCWLRAGPGRAGPGRAGQAVAFLEPGLWAGFSLMSRRVGLAWQWWRAAFRIAVLLTPTPEKTTTVFSRSADQLPTGPSAKRWLNNVTVLTASGPASERTVPSEHIKKGRASRSASAPPAGRSPPALAEPAWVNVRADLPADKPVPARRCVLPRLAPTDLPSSLRRSGHGVVGDRDRARDFVVLLEQQHPEAAVRLGIPRPCRWVQLLLLHALANRVLRHLVRACATDSQPAKVRGSRFPRLQHCKPFFNHQQRREGRSHTAPPRSSLLVQHWVAAGPVLTHVQPLRPTARGDRMDGWIADESPFWRGSQRRCRCGRQGRKAVNERAQTPGSARGPTLRKKMRPRSCNMCCNIPLQPGVPVLHSVRPRHAAGARRMGQGAANGSGATSIAGTGFGYDQPCRGCAAEQYRGATKRGRAGAGCRRTVCMYVCV